MGSFRRIHIGTSGWNYDSWVGPFYEKKSPEGSTKENLQENLQESPKDSPREHLLEEYAHHFATVELNNSFYRMPTRDNIRHWVSLSPENFLFSCKASRYITHMKKLKDPAEGIRRLFDALDHFGGKLGPVLFQLPPRWRANPDRLKHFLEQLPKGHPYTFEFRDRSWLCDEVYQILEEHNAALCFYDYRGFSSPERPTADFIYLRLHGPREEAYSGSYDDRRLAAYARKILRWTEAGRDVYCYFDNDQKACAPHDARRLCQSIEDLQRKERRG